MKRRKYISSLLLLSALSLAVGDVCADPLLDRQWGLINNGQVLLQNDGDLTRSRVFGKQGLDINWVKPKEVENLLHQQGSQNREVIVAVIDSGLDLEHPEFAGRIWENPLCKDLDEQTRLSRPCQGWNFLKNSADLTDDEGHGTHVAGLIVANQDERGIQGVTPKQIKIMPLKVLSKEVNGFVYDGKIITDIIADALIFAINNGAKVVNMSLGWPKVIHTPRMQAAIQEALKKDVILVVATGNNNKDIPTYPCSSQGVLCVGAVDNKGEQTEFTNFSGKVDLLAPGESIVSTYPRQLESRSLRIQGYETKRGSSQASPYVAAVAAVLKLLHPKASALEVQAWILGSTKDVSSLSKDKTSKYSLLDMRNALDSVEMKHFITADFKELLEIKTDEQGRFSFILPITNHLNALDSVTVELEYFGNKKTFTLKEMASAQTMELNVEGVVGDWEIESHDRLDVKISSKQNTLFEASTRIALSRRVEDIEAHKMTLKNLHPEVISFFGRQQKASRMRRVSHPVSERSSVEWFFQDPRIQGGQSSLTDLLVVTLEGHQIKRFKTPKLSQLLSVFKIDLNLDGIEDYLFYGLDEKRENLLFIPLDLEGQALFASYPKWVFPLSQFEGLPLKNSLEDFTWLKHSHPELGDIVVPSFHRVWEMPAADNSDDLLERLFPGPQRRLYYLAPHIKNNEMTLEIRTLESHKFLEDLRRRGLLKDFDTVTISSALAQNKNDRDNGVIKMIMLIGRESQKRPYFLSFYDSKNWSISELHVGVTQLEGNFPQAFIDLQTNEISQTLGFMALLNRATARLSLLDLEQSSLQQFARIVQKTDSWGDPIFNTLGAFETHSPDRKSRTLFLETRYFVYSMVFDEFSQTRIEKLPINRDSSFPGMGFAETIKPVRVQSKKDDLKLPGLLINSSLIYGDRVYAMVQDREKFSRPLSLSFSFPGHCLYLDAEALGGEDSLFLLCRHPDRPLLERAEIVRIELKK